jgi:hypothetical protein
MAELISRQRLRTSVKLITLDGCLTAVLLRLQQHLVEIKKGLAGHYFFVYIPPDVLVNQISSCFTGPSVNNGHALNYGVALGRCVSAGYSTLVVSELQAIYYLPTHAVKVKIPNAVKTWF